MKIEAQNTVKKVAQKGWPKPQKRLGPVSGNNGPFWAVFSGPFLGRLLGQNSNNLMKQNKKQQVAQSGPRWPSFKGGPNQWPRGVSITPWTGPSGPFAVQMKIKSEKKMKTKFVGLHDKTGSIVTVALNHIVAFADDMMAEATIVSLANGMQFEVRETSLEIGEKIDRVEAMK